MKATRISKKTIELESVTYLEVNMLQPTHDDAVEWLLWQVQAWVLLQILDVDESPYELGVQERFIRQSLYILGCVWVDVLQRAGKFVVEALDEGHNGTRDTENLALCDGW